MIIITKNKSEKKFLKKELPEFNSRHESVIYYRKQKQQEAILNIKSVSIQVKDIKKMVYSFSVPLQSYYAMFEFIRTKNNIKYNDEDYITISKRKKANGRLIYALITEDWLINKDELESKTTEDIKNECNGLKKEILRLLDIYEKDKSYRCHRAYDKIKLLRYKVSCLEEYCKNIENTYQNSEQPDNTCPKKKVRKKQERE